MTGSYTKQRTFDRETWKRSCDAWDAGRFGHEWPEWRLMASKAGIIFPPDGTAEDSWADARPSQRAMVIRAIRETPRLLRWAIRQPGVASWSDVIENLLAGRDRMGLEADRREEDWQDVKRSRPVSSVADIVATIRDSLGVDDDR